MIYWWREELKRAGYVSVESEDGTYLAPLVDADEIRRELHSSTSEWIEVSCLDGALADIRKDTVLAVIIVPAEAAEKYYESLHESKLRGDA